MAERFANHKRGHKGNVFVLRYGARLLPELFAHLNPMPYEAALTMERELAEDLRQAGTASGRLEASRQRVIIHAQRIRHLYVLLAARSTQATHASSRLAWRN